jgi:hypothetical protein
MIIWINGSINSGKSTVAKLLGEKLEKTAVLEIDQLRHFISKTPLEESIPLNLSNAVLLIKNFHKNGYEVIVPYPLSHENFDYIKKELLDLNTEMFFFSLKPSLEKVLTNRGGRVLSEWEVERINYHYDVGIPDLKESTIIDNGNQTPGETVDLIMGKLTK